MFIEKEDTMIRKSVLFIVLIFYFPLSFCVESETHPPEPILHEKPSQTPEKIEIPPQTKDEEISARLEDILKATGWFSDPQVTVKNGVVFLFGETKNHQFKDWASDLSQHTQDVTAVVNKIVVLEPSIWDVHMVLHEVKAQGRKVIRSIPALLYTSVILIFFWMLARFVYRVVPHFFRNQLNTSLVQEVTARTLSIFVFILGVYFIFEMSDLTTMALTVISGTGLMGIILGIAFREITENFLASVLLSIQKPFDNGDLVDIVCSMNGYAVTGYVELLTFRATVLTLLDGTSLQIPNSTVYRSNIRNYSTNPNHREDFVINLGVNCSILEATEAVIRVMKENEAILKDPEPLVLVDNLSKDQIGLHIYYWVDARKQNWLKVKSSLMRLIKQVFQEEGISFLPEKN
jgi:small conductance mechanosensitive channel